MPGPTRIELPSYGGYVRVNGSTEYTFTPDYTGLWEFSTSDNGGDDPYLELHDSSGKIDEDDDGAGGYDAVIVSELNAGTEYTLIVGFYDETNDMSCMLTVEYKGVADLFRQIPSSGGEIRVNGLMDFSFIPDKTGVWEFRTSDNGGSDPVLSIYDEDYEYIAGDDDNGGDDNALMNVTLEEGTTYHVIASFYSDEASFLLSVKYIGEYTDGPSGGLIPNEDMAGDGGVYRVNAPTIFAFTPDDTGIWQVITSDNGECDPYLIMYNAEGSVVDEDDDGAGNGNALLTVYLTAGEPFLISAGFYGSGDGSYLLSVSPCLRVPDEGGKVRVEGIGVFVFIPDRSGTWEFRTSNNGDSDPTMKIYDLTGNFIADDDDSGGDRNALITTELSSDSLYLLYMGLLYDYDGTGAYDLTITRK